MIRGEARIRLTGIVPTAAQSRETAARKETGRRAQVREQFAIAVTTLAEVVRTQWEPVVAKRVVKRRLVAAIKAEPEIARAAQHLRAAEPQAVVR
jgi:hypothetical protein